MGPFNSSTQAAVLELKGLQLLEAISGTWGLGTGFHSSYCVEVWQQQWKGFGDLNNAYKMHLHSCGSEHMRYGVWEYGVIILIWDLGPIHIIIMRVNTLIFFFALVFFDKWSKENNFGTLIRMFYFFQLQPHCSKLLDKLILIISLN